MLFGHLNNSVNNMASRQAGRIKDTRIEKVNHVGPNVDVAVVVDVGLVDWIVICGCFRDTRNDPSSPPSELNWSEGQCMLFPPFPLCH